MTLTQDCLNKYCTSFACKIADLSETYYKSLEVGSKCSNFYLYNLVLSTALLHQICDVDIEEETCLSNDDICEIIDKIKQILSESCNC